MNKYEVEQSQMGVIFYIIIITIVIIAAAKVELLSENTIITFHKCNFQDFAVLPNSRPHHILATFCISGCKTTVCLVDDKLTVQQATTPGMSL